jgi:predicted nucleotidyltransferase
MNAILAEHITEIVDLCKRFGVVKLELFGSATGPNFDPDASDFDFIATFAETPGIEFVAFADELERIVGRSVDVLSNHPIRNPYLRREVDATRTVIVDAAVA